MTDSRLHVLQQYFFPPELPKTLPVIMLLLFRHVMLLCGTFHFIMMSGGFV